MLVQTLGRLLGWFVGWRLGERGEECCCWVVGRRGRMRELGVGFAAPMEYLGREMRMKDSFVEGFVVLAGSTRTCGNAIVLVKELVSGGCRTHMSIALQGISHPAFEDC